MMTTNIDLYYSFRSPYSYLSTKGALDVVENYDVEIALRPVLPLAVREPGFFNPANLYKIRYILLDWERRAEMLGMSHVWPSPDPVVQDLTDFSIAEDQPHIYRLVYLGIEAQRRGKGLRFAAEVSGLIFSGTKDWHEGSHLAEAVARAGLDLAPMETAIADASSYQAEVEENQKAQELAGHHGVPLFVYKDEPFFGQDRIDSLCWQLEKDGLKR